MENQRDILAGQVAIVTGGGRGIGRAIAQALALAGAQVAVVARTTEQLAQTVGLIEQAGDHALALSLDVTDARRVQHMVQQVETELGPVDLLVNNAGMIIQPKPIVETDAEMWWRVLDVNLRGPFLCAKAVLPGMTARRRGRIINVTSGLGAFAPPYKSAYAISKGALNRFSEILAAETAKDHIAVFAMDPGMVRTALLEQNLDPEWQKWDNMTRRLLEAGHDVPPEPAGQLALALASGKADSLTGRQITIRDDLDEMITQAQRIREEELYVLRMKTL